MRDYKVRPEVREVFADSLRTIEEREAAGFSTRGLGDALNGLFPEGVLLKSPDDHVRYHLFHQVIAKLNRYAATFEEGGHEDSIHDAGNYAKLLEIYDAEIRNRS